MTRTPPSPIEALDLAGLDLAKFGIITIRVMRGTDVIRRWDA